MYMKIVTEGTVRHLCVMNRPAEDSMTLCGRTVTQDHSWKLIQSPEDDGVSNAPPLCGLVLSEGFHCLIR